MRITESTGVMKALADSSRLLIINSLIDKPQYVEELAQRLNLAVSTISFHLKKLENAKLVYKVKEQYYVVFYANIELLNKTLREIVSFDNIHKPIQDERIKEYKGKVIKTFFAKNKLLRIPVQYKKKLIILHEIAKLFLPDNIYLEKEIDNAIENIFDDYCTIRRYLIDERIMMRKDGKYWLNKEYINKQDKEESIFLSYNKKNISTTKQTRKLKMISRSEIKRNYKLNHTPMGVYQIKSSSGINTYIGSSLNLNGIYNRHIFELSTGLHQIKELQEAWNNSGEKGIIFEILDKLEPKDEPDYNYTEDITTLEDLWIEKFKSEGKIFFTLHGTSVRKKKSTASVK